MKRGGALVLVFALSLESSGCATFSAVPADGPCRDPSTGRYVSCGGGSGSSGGSEGLWIGLGVAAGVGLIGGLIYLATRDASPPASSLAAVEAATERTYATGPRVLTCYDRTGRLISSTAPSCAASGLNETAPARDSATPVAVATPRATPGACRNQQGQRIEIPRDRTCGSYGFEEAGDGPAAATSLCRGADGARTQVSSDRTCASYGLDAWEEPPPARGTLRCFTAAGEVRTTREASCAAGGLFDSVGSATTPPLAESAEAVAERHAAVAHTCVGRTGRMLDLAIDQPCPRGYIDRDAPNHRRHHGRHRRVSEESRAAGADPGIETGSVVDERAGEVAPARPRRRCLDSHGQTIELSESQDCATQGYADAPGSPPREAPAPQTSYGGSTYGRGPVQVRGYIRANGTYVAPYTRRR